MLAFDQVMEHEEMEIVKATAGIGVK